MDIMMDTKMTIKGILYQYLGTKATGLVDFVVALIVAILILVIGFKVAKYIVNVCKRIFARSNMDITLQTFLISAINIALKVLVIFFAITKLGIGQSTIVAMVGSAGLALGLSLQGSLGNIAGGVILLFMKPFKVGDYIAVDSAGKEGVVQAIGIMYTKLHTRDNKEILIPNGALSNASITNVTGQMIRQEDILIGIEYSEDIKKVRRVLEGVVAKEAAALKDQPVQIFVNDFKDSCVEMGVRYWVKTEDYWSSRWSVLENIKIDFDQNGISIPFNQLDVNIVKAD